MRYQYEHEIPADYTEAGCSQGAKFDDYVIENNDVVRIFNATRPLDLNNTFLWIDEHTKEYSPSTLVLDTDDGNPIINYKHLAPKFIIHKKPLNKIRHLNTFLNRTNETLEDGGYLWCHCRTAVLKKQIILNSFPKGINWCVYLGHYFWHRFCAKIPGIKRIYFGITKGGNRTYNRVEVLGRIYRAGFEVIDEEFRHGEFFVLARKIKSPIWDDEPSCAPLIKLKRVGKNGEIIGVYKFRTMYSYSEYLQPYIYEHNHLQTGGKFKDDYRVNMWGKIFRRLWIDELPMILNVLKGELKLVGVRPLSRHYFSLYDEETKRVRVKVKPGLLPPFYAESKTPSTLDEVQASEIKYTLSYLSHPVKTDWIYFWRTIRNIVFRGKRSK